jgi:HAD superfamily hydrolase (TIGR01509 family)
MAGVAPFLSRYQAAIFDLDGTLADSMHVWDHICRDWLAAHGAAAGDSLEQDIALMTAAQSAEYVIRKFGIALPPSRIIKEWENMALRQYRHTIPLKAGAAELVRSLAADGMKLAIATSCFPSACEAFLAQHGLRRCFSVIAYTGETGGDKTFPDVYLACARRLAVPPASCVVFEDLPAALSGVRAAGMGIVAVYDDSSAGEWESFKRQADFPAKTPGDLLR